MILLIFFLMTVLMLSLSVKCGDAQPRPNTLGLAISTFLVSAAYYSLRFY